MIWQLAVLLESLDKKLPPGWEPLVVICNDHKPLSPLLSEILSTYGVRHFSAVNHPRSEKIDFAGGGKGYLALNKITALDAVAAHVAADDLICLMDTDIFLYGDFNPDAIPSGNALADNWLINKPLFYSNSTLSEGVNLRKLLDSLGFETEWKGGGVTIFLTGETLQNRAFVRDCYRFAQVLYLLGRIKKVNENHLAEMPCYALALTAHDIGYEITNCPEFFTGNIKEREIPEGTFYHYYGGRGAFMGSPWAKNHFHDRNMLEADIGKFEKLAQSKHEKYFFALVRRARARLERRAGLVAGSPDIKEVRLNRNPGLRDQTLDSLRFLRYHTVQAMDPDAPNERDLRLPVATSFLYKFLSPVRRLKMRFQWRKKWRLRYKKTPSG